MSGRIGEEPSATPSGKMPECRKVYVIYEGEVTERNYFDHYKTSLGRNCSFEINPIPKIDIDRRQTDRADMIDIAHGYMMHVTTGECTPYYFVTLIMNDYYIYRGKCDKVEDLWRTRKKAVMKLKDNNLVKNDRMTDYNAGLKVVISMLPKSSNYSFEINDSFYTPKMTYNPPYDRVFIVFDRDYSRNDPTSRTKENYDNYIDKCKDYKYDALVSTPMFEFWQLLHHKNIDYSDYHYDLSLSEGKI